MTWKHQRLLRKITNPLEKSINSKTKEIAKGIKQDHRVECMAKAPAYITLKDH